jgi:hypothetical protein
MKLSNSYKIDELNEIDFFWVLVDSSYFSLIEIDHSFLENPDYFELYPSNIIENIHNNLIINIIELIKLCNEGSQKFILAKHRQHKYIIVYSEMNELYYCEIEKVDIKPQQIHNSIDKLLYKYCFVGKSLLHIKK